MTRQEKGYLLIQVTRWTGLTVCVYFVYFIQELNGKKTSSYDKNGLKITVNSDFQVRSDFKAFDAK